MNPDLSIAVSAARATKVRFRVVTMAVLLAAITYVDRVCIGSLSKYIMADLGLSGMQMSFVFSAFALAYALFEIPTAWWADRVGTRKVLTRIVIWWSAFTIATAGAFNYASLLVTRFLFGAGEAGAWPSAARTFSRWIPRRERGTVQGVFFMGAHLAGGVTPPLVLAMNEHFHWRATFVIFGMLGFVWAAVWYAWFRDDPSEHAAVNQAELEDIVAGRVEDAGHSAGWEYWSRLFGHRNTWALCGMYLPNSFAFWFCITWLPTYLEERHGFTAVALGVMAGLPLTLSVFGDLFGGLVTDWLSARYGLRVGRAGLGAAAYLLAAGAIAVGALTTVPIVAAVSISLGVAAVMFTLAASWGSALDVGGNHAGVVSAAMNTSGATGGILCPIVVTSLHGATGDWNSALWLICALFVMGAVCWGLIDYRRPIFAEDRS